MFRRREQRTFTQRLSEAVYPRGGWKRAVMYMQYRVRRLPDSSDRIARGIAVGVMATFTPFYGMHFLVAFILARIVGGNVFAGLAATFVGNPITFPFIGFLCMKLGHLLMGTKFDKEAQRTFMHSFVDAWHDLKENIWALFSGGTYDWHASGGSIWEEKKGICACLLLFSKYSGGARPERAGGGSAPPATVKRGTPKENKRGI